MMVNFQLANRALPQRDSSANLQQLAKAANGDSNPPAATSVTSTNPTGSSITISNIVLLVCDAQKVTTEVS